VNGGLGNSVALSGSDNVTVIGTQGAYGFYISNVTVSGTGNTLSVSNDGHVTLVNGAGASVTGSYDTFTLQSSTHLTVSGGSHNIVDIAGSGNTISISNAKIYYTTASASATITGTGNHIYAYTPPSGGYDFAQSPAATSGASIGTIAEHDTQIGADAAAQAAEAAKARAVSAAQAPAAPAAASSAQFEGAKWQDGTITWAFATGSGTAANPISGSVGSQYQATIESAFQAWASATGLASQEVSDPSKADIQIGWGDFNTASTGILGYTSFESQNGQFMPGTLIRMEDPSQDAFNNPGLTYSGTDAQLYQVALHEIGHALGLAGNSDPNSVMYPFSTASNRMLDATDIGGIQTLYGGTGSDSATQSQGAGQSAAGAGPGSDAAGSAADGGSLTASNSNNNEAGTGASSGNSHTADAGKQDTPAAPGSNNNFVFQPAFSPEVINGVAPSAPPAVNASDFFGQWQALLTHLIQSGDSTVSTWHVSDPAVLTVAESIVKPAGLHTH
jgi:predicted Zn-dependent protease